MEAKSWLEKVMEAGKIDEIGGCCPGDVFEGAPTHCSRECGEYWQNCDECWADEAEEGATWRIG